MSFTAARFFQLPDTEAITELTVIQSFFTTHQEQYMSEEGITSVSAALEKAKGLHYGHICEPGKGNIRELTVEPVC